MTDPASEAEVDVVWQTVRRHVDNARASIAQVQGLCHEYGWQSAYSQGQQVLLAISYLNTALDHSEPVIERPR